jgi:hypothetical protein
MTQDNNNNHTLNTSNLRGKTLQKRNIHKAMIIDILIVQGRITTSKLDLQLLALDVTPRPM